MPIHWAGGPDCSRLPSQVPTSASRAPPMSLVPGQATCANGWMPSEFTCLGSDRTVLTFTLLGNTVIRLPNLGRGSTLDWMTQPLGCLGKTHSALVSSPVAALPSSVSSHRGEGTEGHSSGNFLHLLYFTQISEVSPLHFSCISQQL